MECCLPLMKVVSRVVIGRLGIVAMVVRAVEAERELSMVDPIDKSRLKIPRSIIKLFRLLSVSSSVSLLPQKSCASTKGRGQ